MKIIRYISILNYLVKEEHQPIIDAYRTIQSVRQLPSDLKEAVYYAIEGRIIDIEVQDVSLQELIEKDGMSPIRAILMMDWLRREPAVAIRYLGGEKLRTPQKISESSREMLDDAINRLRPKVNAKPNVDVDENKGDIEI